MYGSLMRMSSLFNIVILLCVGVMVLKFDFMGYLHSELGKFANTTAMSDINNNLIHLFLFQIEPQRQGKL